MGERENLDYVKDKHRYAPWLLLAFLLLLVFLMALSAFKRTEENPALDKNSPGQSLSEQLKKVNGQTDDSPKQDDDQQNSSQQASPQNFIGKIQTKMDLNLHSEPGQSGNVVGVVRAGTTLSVKAKVENWYQVVTPENTEGYITRSTKYISIIEMQEW